MSGFRFSWTSRPIKPNNSSSDTISVNGETIITFNQSKTEISIQSTFPSIKDPKGKYVQSDLISDDYLPNTNENFYFTAGIEFYKWLDPDNYRHLLVFFDNLLKIATELEPLQLLYLVRFVDGIIQQLLFDMFNYNNESGIPDPKQAQIMQLAETILTNQRPKFGTKLDGKLSALNKEEIDEINQSSIAQLKNIEALLGMQQKERTKQLRELKDKLSEPGLEKQAKQALETHKQELENLQQRLEQVLILIQNALRPSSTGQSPSGGGHVVFSGPPKANSLIADQGI